MVATTKPSVFEREVLDVVLLELRRAMRMRAPLHFTVDPFLVGRGAIIFASPDQSGRTYEIDASMKRRRTR